MMKTDIECPTTRPGACRIRRWAVALVVALFLFAPAAAGAQSGEQRDPRRLEQRIEAMLREAEELQEAGRHDRAEAVRDEARQLARRLEGARERGGRRERGERREREERPHGSAEELEEILHGLEQGVVALRRLGDEDGAEHLQRIGAEVRRQMRELRSDRARREREGQHRRTAEHAEVREARRQLEILHVAKRALLEADRRDAAEQLEHAIHARELALEGRRDEEAAEVRRSAPGRGEQGELLMIAAEVLHEHGARDRAEIVGDYARRLANQARERHATEREREYAREREHEREHEHERRREGQHGRGRDDDDDDDDDDDGHGRAHDDDDDDDGHGRAHDDDDDAAERGHAGRDADGQFRNLIERIERLERAIEQLGDAVRRLDAGRQREGSRRRD